MNGIRNVKLISNEDIHQFESEYDITLKDNSIVVKSLTRNTSTLHPIDKSFTIASRHIRKITLSLDAINLWKNHFMLSYSLFRVQAAINELTITYSPINVDTVKQYLISHR